MNSKPLHAGILYVSLLCILLQNQQQYVYINQFEAIAFRNYISQYNSVTQCHEKICGERIESMDLNILQQILQIIASIITILGFPAGIYLFYDAKRKEQRDREFGTYNALDEKYLEYLELCLQNWDLDVFDVPLITKKKSSQEQIRKEQIMFAILISILERAYLMYKDKSTALKRSQFLGWDTFMREWSARANFQRAWKQAGIDPETFDRGFCEYMNKMMEANSKPTH